MGRTDTHLRKKRCLQPTVTALFPALQDCLDLLKLQSVLAAAEIAGNDRIGHGSRSA